MKNKKITKKIMYSLCVLVFCFMGCGKKDANQEMAKVFVQAVFTVPYEKFPDTADPVSWDGGIDQFNEIVDEAMESLCGEFVAEKTLEDKTSSLYLDIVTLHMGAFPYNSDDYTYEGYTYEVKSIEITKSDDKHYSYKVEVHDSNADEQLTMFGNLQFNEDSLIDYMTIQGQGF